MLKRIAPILALCFFASASFAQSVQQSGSVTRNHGVLWNSNGVVQDAGSASDSPLSSFGVDGQLCVMSDRLTAAGRNLLCFQANTGSAATISLQNYGTASAQNLQFVLNGVPLTLPSGGGTFATLSGSPPYPLQHLTNFNLTTGVLGDSGVIANNGTITLGAWNGTPVPVLYGGTGATTASQAQSNLGLGTLAIQNANNVAITGGAITGMPSPSNPSDVAIKSYVDATSQGLHILPQTRLATATVLPNTPTYSNGSSGVGATLTSATNTTLTVDGTTANLNDVILVQNQSSAFQNGIYTVTTAGDGSDAWVLTRATYFDTSALMLAGSYTFVTAGATNINSSFVLQNTVTTVGTTAATFVLFATSGNGVTSVGGATGAITLGNGLAISGQQINTGGNVDANVLNTQTSNYTIASTDCGATIQAGTGSTGFFTVSLPVVAGFNAACTVNVLNGDTTRGKGLSGFPSTIGSILYPTQEVTVKIVNGAWAVTTNPQRWRVPASTTVYVRPDGSDSNDGLANSSTGAFITANAAVAAVMSNMDLGGRTDFIIKHTCGTPPCTITNAGQLLAIATNVANFVGGVPTYEGDCTTPSNVTLAPSTSIPADIQVTYGQNAINICGFTLAGSANATQGIYVSGGAIARITGPMIYGNVTNTGSVHIQASSGGKIFVLSNYTISNTSTVVAHTYVNHGGIIEFANNLTVTCTGSPPFDIFALGATNGSWNGLGTTYTNCSGVTGQRYNVQSLASIETFSGGANYFPGNSAGSISGTTPGGGYF